ncbi:MAG: ABC transporter substrate-binding protein [Pantoea sp.]|uniref:ABC transporter substrate-binding protein n=1 Tax=Pantoea sp. TaxID=69393 RepID=UPI002390FA7C|nr:ABC transporter substrate-binding protein [Pantoea sp.]MDE1186862.1 ABC transporter substrate-binding protein [Pantoea sp.]
MNTRREFLRNASMAAMGAVAGAHKVFAATPRDSVTIAYPVDVLNWDAIAFSSLQAMSLLKSMNAQPFTISPTGSVEPELATDFKWLGSDGLAFEVTLRDDVTFHNGDKLTSDDFKFTFLDRCKADKTLALGAIWKPIVGIDTPSPTRAIVHLGTPMAAAKQRLAYTAAFIQPRKYFEQVGREEFLKRPIGAGPYRLVEYQRDSRAVFEAYENYWRGPAKIKRVTVDIVKDDTARVSAVQAGKADIAVNLPIREVERLGKAPGLTGLIKPTPDIYTIQMVNTGPWTDKNVRLAAHHAINKEALSKAFFGGVAPPIWTPSGPGTPAYAPDFKLEYSQAKAKSLLAASGYSPDKPVKVKFITTTGGGPSDYDIARAIVQMWKAVGIDADLRAIDVSQFASLSMTNKLDAPCLYVWQNGMGDPSMYSGSMLHPDKPFSTWKSDDLREPLNKLEAELDYEKRIGGYRDLDIWAAQQGYSLTLLQSVSTTVYRKGLNFVPYNNGWMLPYDWS